MATEKGIWDLQQVRDKQLVSEWDYTASDPYALWAWGDNHSGGLGLNQPDNSLYSSPVQVGTDTNWTYLMGGAGDNKYHFGAITVDGTLYTWGNNANGQLGINLANTTARSSPTQVPGTTWKYVKGRNANVAVKTDGTLWSWGQENSGQLGQNSAIKRSSPTQIGTGTDWDYSSPYKISHGALCSAAIKTDGTLWIWGYNNKGQLGNNEVTEQSSPIQIPGTWNSVSSSTYTNIGTKTDGTLWSWGDNDNGYLGQNDTIEYSSPVQIGTGTDWDYSSPYKISHGALCSAAIKTDGSLWIWGYNNRGQLGNNEVTEQSSPIQIPGTWNSVSSSTYTNIGTKTDGTLWSWGDNDNGYLGQNDTIEYSSPVQIGTGTDWGLVNSDISRYALGAIKTDGTLWTWGSNNSGSTGTNTGSARSSPVQVPGTTWKQVAWGDDGSAGATKTDGTLWQWANNASGQLGQNNETTYSSPRQVPGTWNTVAQARLKTFALR